MAAPSVADGLAGDIFNRELGRYTFPPTRTGLPLTLTGLDRWIGELDLVRTIDGPGHGPVRSIAWSPSGSVLASTTDTNSLHIFRSAPDAVSSARFDPVRRIGTTAPLNGLAFAPHSSNRIVFGAGSDSVVRVFDLEQSSSTTTTPVAELTGHTGEVWQIVTELSPNLFLTCADDGAVIQWDRRDSRPCSYLARHAGIKLRALSVSPSQPHYLVVGGTDENCFLHDRRMAGELFSPSAATTATTTVPRRQRRRRPPQASSLMSPTWPPSFWSDQSDQSDSPSDPPDLAPPPPPPSSSTTRCVRNFPGLGTVVTGIKISDYNPDHVLVSWIDGPARLFSLTRPNVGCPPLTAVPSSKRKWGREHRPRGTDPSSERSRSRRRHQHYTPDPDLDDDDEDSSDRSSQSDDELDDETTDPDHNNNTNPPTPAGPFDSPHFSGHRSSRTSRGMSFLGPRDDFVASGCDSGHVFVWSRHTGRLVQLLRVGPESVTAVVPSPDGTVFAAPSRGSAIALFSTNARDQVAELDRLASGCDGDDADNPVEPATLGPLSVLRELFGRVIDEETVGALDPLGPNTTGFAHPSRPSAGPTSTTTTTQYTTPTDSSVPIFASDPPEHLPTRRRLDCAARVIATNDFFRQDPLVRIYFGSGRPEVHLTVGTGFRLTFRHTLPAPSGGGGGDRTGDDGDGGAAVEEPTFSVDWTPVLATPPPPPPPPPPPLVGVGVLVGLVSQPATITTATTTTTTRTEWPGGGEIRRSGGVGNTPGEHTGLGRAPPPPPSQPQRQQPQQQHQQQPSHPITILDPITADQVVQQSMLRNLATHLERTGSHGDGDHDQDGNDDDPDSSADGDSLFG